MNYLLNIFLISNIDANCLDDCMHLGKLDKECYRDCKSVTKTEYSNRHYGSKLRELSNGLNNGHKNFDQGNQYKQNHRGHLDQYNENELDGQYRLNDNQYGISFGQHNQYRENDQTSSFKGRQQDPHNCYYTCMKHSHQSDDWCRHTCYKS